MLLTMLKAKLHEIEQSVLIQEEGFRAIVNGSQVSFEARLRCGLRLRSG